MIDDIYDLDAYDYELPVSAIAQEHAVPRDASRLLVWNGDNVDYSHTFRDITQFLRSSDLLILNNTRVIPARLQFTRPTGGKTEILLLRNITGSVWEALVKPSRRFRLGDTLEVHGLTCEVIDERPEGIRVLRFEDTPDFTGWLERHGELPLPPYIRRHTHENIAAYQTVFAEIDGSVAAPTASLHFTRELLDAIRNMGVNTAYVTLHVGLDTFRPVKAHDIREHVIHTEHCEISPETARMIREAKRDGGRVIACGTTAVRTLETFGLESGIRDTNLFIYPGYKFRVVDALITNFHLPKSSLLMLVAAFASDRAKAFGHEDVIIARMLEIYREALSRGFRFFSLGDAMLIL